MKTAPIRQQVALAVAAAEAKKALDISILQLDKNSSAFTDYFVICSGSNPRQIQAIADDVELRLKQAGSLPNNVEGYNRAEWVLLDYVDFVIHIFSEAARAHYNLERLWKSAKKLTTAELSRPERPTAQEKRAAGGTRVAVKRSAKKASTKRPSRATSVRSASKKGSRRGASSRTNTRKKK
jgi:ribosome-associated protein